MHHGRELCAGTPAEVTSEPSLIEAYLRLIREIQSRGHLAVVSAEQNVDWALRIASRALTIEVGRVTPTGTAAELRGNEHVRPAILAPDPSRNRWRTRNTWRASIGSARHRGLVAFVRWSITAWRHPVGSGHR